MPTLAEVARRLGRTRMILWGGALADSPRAVRYSEKNGFPPVGSFAGAHGSVSLDTMLDLCTQ